MTRFDPKKFQNKLRVYTQIANAPGVSRLWRWSHELQRYDVPAGAKPFVAARYHEGRREKRFFDSLDEARGWQRGLAPSDAHEGPPPIPGPG